MTIISITIIVIILSVLLLLLIIIIREIAPRLRRLHPLLSPPSPSASTPTLVIYNYA